MWTHLYVFVGGLKSRWHTINERPDAGYASEAVLVTALLILLAIAVISIIAAKVTAKANDIDLGLIVQTVVP
jgi:hypothetical protein